MILSLPSRQERFMVYMNNELVTEFSNNKSAVMMTVFGNELLTLKYGFHTLFVFQSIIVWDWWSFQFLNPWTEMAMVCQSEHSMHEYVFEKKDNWVCHCTLRETVVMYQSLIGFISLKENIFNLMTNIFFDTNMN